MKVMIAVREATHRRAAAIEAGGKKVGRRTERLTTREVVAIAMGSETGLGAEIGLEVEIATKAEIETAGVRNPEVDPENAICRHRTP